MEAPDGASPPAAPAKDPEGRTDASSPTTGADRIRVALGSRPAIAALWVLAVVGAGVLALQRYRVALAVGVVGDFRIYFAAARSIAAGHSPYEVSQYVYPPLIAAVLAPGSHFGVHAEWRVWDFASCASLVAVPGVFVLAVRRHLTPLQRPLLFGVGAVTAMHFWPTTLMLSLGQSDAFVLLLLTASVLATEEGWSKTSGVLLASAGLLKVWPAAAAVSTLRRGYRRRWSTLASFGATLVVALALGALLGGFSDVTRLFRVVFSARSQHLVNDSVWGFGSMNFSRSGLAHPLFVSAPVQVLATGILLAWVVVLLVVTLRVPGQGSVLPFWNVVFCIVLVLPVSHLAYAMYGLPVLWWWIARLLHDWRRPAAAVMVVAGVLVIWWLVLNKGWPDSGSAPTISSVRYSVVFGIDLVACTASVLGATMLARTGGTRGGRTPTGPSADAAAI